MLIKDLIEEDFVNYKLPSMVISFPRCNFKCGKNLCQNSKLATMPDIEVEPEYIAKRYVENEYTKAVVMSGMEPFDSFDEVYDLISILRRFTDDMIVLYSGYYKEEIKQQIERLRISGYKNIIVKFGRYIPNQESYFNDLLGVNIANIEQYAEKIS